MFKATFTDAAQNITTRTFIEPDDFDVDCAVGVMLELEDCSFITIDIETPTGSGTCTIQNPNCRDFAERVMFGALLF